MIKPRRMPYGNLRLYYGDIHSHCNMSYGHGTLAEAMRNARTQLDFASITIHAVWPDLPMDDPKLKYLVEYHEKGFERASANWAQYLLEVDEQNQDGQFITFPSYEWHSSAYGDHCVYYKDTADSPILDVPDLPALRRAVSQLNTHALIIPHHIGYKQGSRGINWSAFTEAYSPVAEIFSFHGLSESSEGPYPYLHSMGPCHEQSTAQYGWSQGHVFGVVASTDHHNAFPGSYGYGRLGVWAESLTRHEIWEAIRARRTYALTGDRIDLRYTLNGELMGGICPANSERYLEVAVAGGDVIDYVDVLHNNQVVHRECVLPSSGDADTYKIYIELGWGENFEQYEWDVDINVEGGSLIAVEPRLRGFGPTDMTGEQSFAYSHWEQYAQNRVKLSTRTRPNASLHTASTEGLSLVVAGEPSTILRATINGEEVRVHLGDLLNGSRTFYMGGFVSPAVCFHQAAADSEYTCKFSFHHKHASGERDWYYVRVRQRNNQWAWGSPIWIVP